VASAAPPRPPGGQQIFPKSAKGFDGGAFEQGERFTRPSHDVAGKQTESLTLKK
jgi:hypothetical protein